MSFPKQVSATTGRILENTRTKEILQVAADLFDSSGYASTTMHDIGDAAGVLPGSLYHHFASKEDIAVELLAAFYADLETTLAASIAASRGETAPSVEPLRRLANDIVSISLRHGAAIRLRSYDVPTTATHKLRELVKYQPSILDRAWRLAMTAAKPRLRVPPVDLRLLRFTFHRATLEASQVLPPTLSASAIAEQLCDVLLNGLAPDCPPDADLDRSEASRVAKEIIGRWKARGDDIPSDRRSAIVAVARREFSRRGYDATTIRDIADAAGLTMGTLYRNVKSKESLLGGILHEYSSFLDSGIGRVLAADSSEVEVLDALGKLIIHASRQFRDEYNIVKLWKSKDSSGPLKTYLDETQHRLQLLGDFFSHGKQSGSFRIAGDADLTTVLVRGMMWLPFDESGRVSMNRVHHFLRETVLRGALARA